MPNFNQVLLMGNVTRDPQLKQLPNGSSVVDFGLASNRKYRTAAGEDKEETCFVDCAAFGKQAEVIHQYCQKGKPLFIEGRLKYDTWEDKSGAKRSKVSVIVENFQFLGSKDGGGSFQGSAASREWREDSGDGEKKTRRRASEEKQFDGPAKFSQADIPF
jgi:single-strand DNA-binding protein